LVEAVAVHARYDTALIDHTDDGVERVITRREYNETFDQTAPEVELSDAATYLWDWYFDIDARVGRVSDGVCRPIPPSEWLAWAHLTGHVVYRWEFAILAAMDLSYCQALNSEFSDRSFRRAEKAKTGKR